MNLEKFVNSKFYLFCEWLWRIVMLNFLTLITSLGIITFIPSVIACMQCFKDYEEGTDDNVFKVFYRNFGKHFKGSLVFSIVFVILFLAIGYSIALYYVNVTDPEVEESLYKFYTLGMYVSILFAFVISIIYLQIPLIQVYFKFGKWEAYRNAFYMSFRYIFITLIGVASVALSVFIFLMATILWFFIGVSLPIYILYAVSKKRYLYLSYNVFDIKTVDEFELDFSEEKEDK